MWDLCISGCVAFVELLTLQIGMSEDAECSGKGKGPRFENSAKLIKAV